MKKTLSFSIMILMIIFLASCTTTSSQPSNGVSKDEATGEEYKVVYLDSNFNEIPNKKYASYYRKIYERDGKYYIEDYWLDDVLQSAGYCSDIKNVEASLDGKSTFYYRDGSKRSEQYFKDGASHGSFEVFDKKGNTILIGNYKEGLAEGEFKGYFDTGELKNKKTYEDGFVEGEALEYYKNGNVAKRHKYEENRIIGVSESYYDNGKLQAKEPHKAGVIHGLVEVFYESGTLLSTSEYADGEPHGKTLYYNDDGSIISTETYVRGRKVKEE